jgi:hypothetical protein
VGGLLEAKLKEHDVVSCSVFLPENAVLFTRLLLNAILRHNSIFLFLRDTNIIMCTDERVFLTSF